MNAHLDQFWITGLVAVLMGLSALFLIVRRDLVPKGPMRDALSGEKRWALASALGIGIFAFSLKLFVVFMLTTFPEKTIAPQLDTAHARMAEARAEIAKPLVLSSLVEEDRIDTLAWSALPTVAPAPETNPTTPAKIALGQRLFNDARLSKDGTLSCASCHALDAHAGGDGLARATGVEGQKGPRNTPTVFNTAFQARLFWDGRSASLEDQAFGPLLNPVEMAMPSAQAVVAVVKTDPSYAPLFQEAFGPHARITSTTIAKALAAFERTLITSDTPYDRFINGDEAALSPAQKRGMKLFQSLGCKVCHAGANFSGASLIGPRRPFAHLRAERLDAASFGTLSAVLSTDKGRAPESAKRGLWRIPSLRNVALTGPYFHNGSVTELRDAVRIMARAQLGAELDAPIDARAHETPHWSAERQEFSFSNKKRVTAHDIDDIVAFLHALSSDNLSTRMGK